MPIEYKFGVPISALGRMAYAVGAGEAARKREQEDRERQMQMMRMQQQQMEAERNRQFDVWRNQYQHGSAMQRMQADHEWRDNFQHRGQEHERAMFSERADAKLEYDTEMNKIRHDQDQRMAMLNHANSMEKQADYAMRQENNQEADYWRRKKGTYETRMRDSLNLEKGRPAWDEFNAQKMKIRAKKTLSEEEKKTQISQIEQQQYALTLDDAMKKKGLGELGGFEDRGSIRVFNMGDGEYKYTPRPGFTMEQYERDHPFKSRIRYDSKNNVYEKSGLVLVDGKFEETWSFDHRGEPTPEERVKRSNEDWKTRTDLMEKYFEAPDLDEGRDWTLKPAGRAALEASGIHGGSEKSGFVPARKGDRDALINHAMEKLLGRQGDSGQAGPGSNEGAGVGRPFSVEGDISNIGEQRQADVLAPQPGAAPVERAAAGERAAAQAPVQAVAEEEVEAVARGLAKDFAGSGQEGQAQFGLHASSIIGGTADFPQHFPLSEEDRQKRQLAYHQALTQQGQWPRRGARAQTMAGVPGVEPAYAPAEGTSLFGPGGSIGGPAREAMEHFHRTGGELVAGTERMVEQGMAMGKEKIAKPLGELGSLPDRVVEEAAGKKERYGAKKASDEKQAASEKALYKGMMKGTPGLKVQVPKAYSRLTLRDQTVSKVHGREKYEKFSKELRNYAHRLKNNKDASADMKKRLDRIRARGKDITERELEDELRVMKMVGRVTGATKKSAAWKSFVYKDQWWFDKAFGTGVYPAGKRSRVTAAKVLKKDVDKWVAGMSRLVKTLEDMGL